MIFRSREVNLITGSRAVRKSFVPHNVRRERDTARVARGKCGKICVKARGIVNLEKLISCLRIATNILFRYSTRTCARAQARVWTHERVDLEHDLGSRSIYSDTPSSDSMRGAVGFFLIEPFRGRQSEFARTRPRPRRENGQRRVAGFERIFARRFVNPVVRNHVDVCRHFLARRSPFVYFAR